MGGAGGHRAAPPLGLEAQRAAMGVGRLGLRRIAEHVVDETE